jgi:AraC family transcriptional regulator, regulatory protein of adaptative response / methylated-DNA-[protein]-cysteine methyltransferase
MSNRFILDAVSYKSGDGSMQKQGAEYFQAFMARDRAYEGLFFAGITSTGIFCRPTCPARKPRIENCVFFHTAEAALAAGYRACKRCKPVDISPLPAAVHRLVSAIEAEPSRRWREADISTFGLDPSTARRQFKARFGMTFVAYARARRMEAGVTAMGQGSTVIQAQLESGYESGSGFREAFAKMMGAPPNVREHKILRAEWIDTPLGTMLALADRNALHLLEFTERRALEKEITALRVKHGYTILPGRTPVTDQVKEELSAYFSGELKAFTVPLHFYGSAFQKRVLESLLTIPYGHTRSYAQQASFLGLPKAVRAIARANGANQLAIIIPCHRVIGSDGSLTGYAGGLARKKWLLEHENGQDLFSRRA